MISANTGNKDGIISIQFAPNQMNNPGLFVEFYTGLAYSSGLAQTV